MTALEDRPYRYNEVIYPSRAVWYAHPRNMAMLAHLLSLKPADVETCRVLELGAGTGGNLIPMAAHLPRARFVGYDLAERQIAVGRDLTASLELKNVELYQADIRSLAGDLDEFDYIICHGVYSWVTSEVQEAILDICRDHLAPNGLAAISYNVLPGWSVRLALHHLLRHQDDESLEAHARIDRAVQELRDLKAHLDKRSDPRSQHLLAELVAFNKMDQSYFFHEYLESVNEPIFFDVFAGSLQRYDLQFLGNLVSSNARFAHWPEGDPGLDEGDIVRQEAVRDIRQWRRFRASLLGSTRLEPVRAVSPERLYPLSMSMRIDDRDITVDMVVDGPMTIIGPDGKPDVLRHGLDKTARALLDASPAALTFEELFAMLPEQIEGQPWTAHRFAGRLLRLYFAGALRLHMHPPSVANALSEKPYTPLLTRLEAQNDEWVTNAWHSRIKLGTVQRVIIQFLDGEHDLDQIAEEIKLRLDEGELSLNPPDTPSEKILGIIPEVLEEFVQLGMIKR